MSLQFGKMGLATLSLTALGLLALPGGARAQAQDPPVDPAATANDPTMKKVSLDLESTNLYSALKLLFGHINANYYLDPSLKNAEVSVHLHDIPFKIVLDTLVKSTGLPLTWKFEDNIYRIVPKETEITGAPETGATTDPAAADAEKTSKFVIISRDTFSFDGVGIAEALGGKSFSILPRIFDYNPFSGQGGGQGGQQGGQQGGGIGGASALLPDGIQSLLAFSNDGSLLVKYDPARPEALTELRKIIRLLDVKPRQIQVKAEFVTISQNDINSFGINFQFQKVNLVGGTNTGFAGTGGQAFLQYATGNLSTQLSFALTQGHAKVVASPIITTLNNMPVNFFVQSNIPVFQTSIVLGNGGQTIVTSTISAIQVQTGLSFVARINGDESLTVFGSATNYVLGASFTSPDGQSFPNITTQTTPIQRIIRNGDTMVIGGLNSKNDVVNTLKVPLLGDLPFIGNLFRSRSITTDDRELLVFITPTILPERISTAGIGGNSGSVAIPTGGGGGLPLPGPTP